MTDKLTPEETQIFRSGQKKRARVIMLMIIIWVAAIFALTLVKGQMAAERREAQQTGHAESE